MAYIPSLDGIRAISVFIVLFAHAGLSHIIPGGFGVTVFFFLSGFLITTLLLREHEKTQHINIKNFFIRRIFRLYPPLLCCLVLSYVLVALGLAGGGTSFAGLLYQLLYLANYHQIFSWAGEIPQGLGILWSLAVEEHFYLFFPLLMGICLGRLSRFGVATVILGLCIIVLLWRIYLVIDIASDQYRTYYATDTRIDSILFGCLLAACKNPIDFTPIIRFKFKDILLLSGAILLLAISFLYRDPIFRETARYTVQGIALMPLFYYSINAHNNPLFSWLDLPWIKKLGVYSYFIYLIHLVAIKAIKFNDLTDNIAAIITLSTVISIAFAFVIDTYIDPFFRELRKKFS